MADHDIVGEGVRLVRNGRVAIRWSRPRLLLEPFVRVEPSFHFISNLFALSRSSLSEAVFLKMGLADHDIVGEGACLVREHDLVQGSGSRVQGFAVLGLGFRIQGLGVRVYGLGLRVHGLWCMV